MSSLLDGDVAVVTGAANGIGRATARTFAEHGADVVTADLDEGPRGGGTPTHELINEETDSSAAYVACDVTDVDHLEATVSTAVDDFGRLDCIVNNAGISRRHDFIEITEEEYQEVMDVNAKSVFFGAQAAAKQMVEQSDGGSIVNLSSITGIMGSQTSVPYSGSKGAVRLMTYSLAAQLGSEGIRVNAIHPGFVQTELSLSVLSDQEIENQISNIPLGRGAQPQDVANLALYLASDLSSFVNAQSILVDGGEMYTW